MRSDAKLMSVNVGLPRSVVSNGDPVSTGIFKEPVAGRVMLRTLNLDGDRQADLSVHGLDSHKETNSMDSCETRRVILIVANKKTLEVQDG
jgi:hypothetical protein